MINVKGLISPNGGMTIKKVLIGGIFWAGIYQLSLIFHEIDWVGMLIDFKYIVSAFAMIYFLRMNNDEKKYFIPISVSIFILNLLMLIGSSYDFLWIPAVSIFLFYAFRFFYKREKGYLDIGKFLILILYVFIPMVMWGPFRLLQYEWNEQMNFLAITYGIIYISMFLIYFFESIAISQFYNKHKQTMKKFVVPLLFIQAVIAIGFLVFSIVQKIEADRAREEAIYQRVLAVKNVEEAKRQQQTAEKEKTFFQSRVKILEDSIQLLKRR